MKPEIHPKYRHVVFRDVSCDFEFLTQSTIQTKKTTTYEGKEYPLVGIDISSQSHPFYTGTQKILDTAGRVERFYRKYGFKQEAEEQEVEEQEVEETGTEE
ncbi:MAG: type B 50S ribosomal protein L31 [Deltaproteobacteria bacterium]|nr:type B 50S ribosomal protein L31 [Deltaproteobacteria bacterium]